MPCGGPTAAAWPRPTRPGDSVTIAVTGPVTPTWHLVATAPEWEFGDQPGPRIVARLTMNTEQAWRLLTSNLPAAAKAALAASGGMPVERQLFVVRHP